MNQFSIESLRQPEYLHLLLHPVPIYGLAMGMVALVASLILRNCQARQIALWLVFVSSATAGLVYLSGQRAYHEIYLLADGDGLTWLDTHRLRAERWIYLFYGVALLALPSALLSRRMPKAAVRLAVLTAIVGTAALAVGGWISHPGGKVRHPELRAPARGEELPNEAVPASQPQTENSKTGTKLKTAAWHSGSF